MIGARERPLNRERWSSLSRNSLILTTALILGLAAPAGAAPPSGATFGGPNSVVQQMDEDRTVQAESPGLQGLDGALAEYFDFKDRLRTEHGLSFGLDYNVLAQTATASPGERFAVGGVGRLFGQWALIGRDSEHPGSLVFKGESRHALWTEIAPQELGPEVGYAGLTSTTFSDKGFILTNFYWMQHLFDGELAFVLGEVDVTDYVNSYALFNPWTDFSNLAFQNGATIPAPSQGLGAAVSAMITEHVYVVGGLADANGEPARLHDIFDSFFDTAEFFTHLELGWIESLEQKYSDNVHVTAWHADERDDAGTSKGWGANFSWNHRYPGGFQPFFRAGFAQDGGAFLSRSVSLGLGYSPGDGHDQLGVGLNWGRPSPDTFGRDLPDQYTAEAYFHIQLTKVVAITPAIQVLVKPALDPNEDVIAVFGLRLRFSF